MTKELILLLFATAPLSAVAQSSGQLSSRVELTAAVAQAERSGQPLQAAALRTRLRDGDFQIGDRIILTVVADVPRTDTLVVREGRVIDLPIKSVVDLNGVLRSEVKDRISAEVLKYVKAVDITVTPLTRIAVLGEVARPGYFAVRSDIPISDAIMIAGGPTGTADIERSVVRRANREYRSAEETRDAVTRGLTLDQFGLGAGDEIVIGKHRQLVGGATAAVGMLASLAAIFFAARHH